MSTWVCYEYCSGSPCPVSVYYRKYSKCRLVDANGNVIDTKITDYGCKC